MLKRFIRLIGLQRHQYKSEGINYHVCEACGEEIYIPAWSEFQYRLTEFRGCKTK